MKQGGKKSPNNSGCMETNFLKMKKKKKVKFVAAVGFCGNEKFAYFYYHTDLRKLMYMVPKISDLQFKTHGM